MSTLCAAASKTAGMLDNLPVVREAFPKTVRLVSTARLRPPVLAQLVSAEDLDGLPLNL